MLVLWTNPIWSDNSDRLYSRKLGHGKVAYSLRRPAPTLSRHNDSAWDLLVPPQLIGLLDVLVDYKAQDSLGLLNWTI